MKNYVKKLISSLMAISLVAPVFSGIPVFAENSDGTIVDQTQALTVVGKRIKGDDTYFEISLEVNEDHDNFSSVGVVLRYDPDYIIPAESWDEGAGAADMSENTTWATRRALPTLGLETWSTHTALAYQEDTPAPGAAGGKKYGYLYLGAEHPLAVEEPEATADPSATAAPTADPSAPTAEPEATPAPGTRPVVVARFVYKTTAGDATAVPPVVEVTGANMKAKLTEDWTTGTNSSGSAEPINWDYDWTSNKILTIADDDVAGKSPAQYPFAIYTQDYVEKAYMHTWPTITPTATTAPGDPTPTPMPVSAYAPVIGTGVDAANHLTKDDIMIITCEGESAKATGGLKLSDIYTILFFDWDDSLLGALTAGQGAADMNKTVSEYVKSKMVHPDLQNNTNYSSLAREDAYRGQYPETGPNASDPLAKSGSYGDDAAEPGSKYPITNKLDYVFAGKEFYEDAPYAGGWTKVMAEELSTTYSWFGPSEMVAGKYGKAVEIDSVTGYALDASGNPDPSIPIPEMISCDFDNITLDDGESAVLVKAVYWPCEMLDNGTPYYSSDVEQAKIEMISDLSSDIKRNYGISFNYFRINKYGYGVTKAKIPKMKMALTQVGASNDTTVQVDVENQETVPILLTPSNDVAHTGYQLVDIYGYNILTGTASSEDTGKTFDLEGTDGFKLKTEYNYFLNELYTTGTSTAQLSDMLAFGFKFSWTKATAKKPTGTVTEFKSAANVKNGLKYIGYYLDEAKSRGDINGPEDLTWAMLQYAILNSTTAAKAKSSYKTASECENMFVIDDSQDYTYYAANHYYMEKPNYSWMK